LLHPQQKVRAGQVRQLADVFLVRLDERFGRILLLFREFQVVQGPFDPATGRPHAEAATATRTSATTTTRAATEPAAEAAPTIEPGGKPFLLEFGCQLLDLVLVEGAVLVGIALGDQVLHAFG